MRTHKRAAVGALTASSLFLGAFYFTACSEAEQTSEAPEPVASVQQEDKISDCLKACQSKPLGSDARYGCCSKCILDIPYQSPGDPEGRGWVCSTETKQYEICIGQDGSGIKPICADNKGCGPGFHEVPFKGKFSAGEYCYKVGHAVNFACYDCDGDGKCTVGVDDFATADGAAPNCNGKTAICNTSGGNKPPAKPSHYTPCLGMAMTTCCAPNVGGAGGAGGSTSSSTSTGSCGQGVGGSEDTSGTGGTGGGECVGESCGCDCDESEDPDGGVEETTTTTTGGGEGCSGPTGPTTGAGGSGGSGGYGGYGGYGGSGSAGGQGGLGGTSGQGGSGGSSGYCGDGSCGAGEDSSNCSSDCGSSGYCGDGSCGAGEDASNCSSDCGSSGYCGDGSCGAGEDSSNCSSDCGSSGYCGDGYCVAGEDASNCSSDCGSSGYCGDGSCGVGEDASNCSYDCGSSSY